MHKLLLSGASVVALLASAPAVAQIASADVTGGAVAGTVLDNIGTSSQESGAISVFKGIPFAAPPLGANRWRAPQPVVPWQGTLAATKQAPPCMQDAAVARSWNDPQAPSEDCLYLNLWTPAHDAGARLPVMVWIFGGGFSSGMTSIYNGINFARKGVVYVAVAYRVGPFGFMGHRELASEGGGASGNYGLRDQIAGLKWVQANIAKFGGDPANVTIFGESAGGISVSMLAASPLAKGLFAKAISESGGNFGSAQRGDFKLVTRASDMATAGGLTMRSAASGEHQGAALLATLGVKGIAEARALPAESIQKQAGPMGTFWPNFDGQVLTRNAYALYRAGKYNATPVLIGTNSDEGALFMPPKVPADAFRAGIRAGYGRYASRLLAAYPNATDAEAKQAMADIFQDTAFAWPTWAWARLQSARPKTPPAYVYFFDHKTAMTPHGSWHGSEIRYVFDALDAPSPFPSTPVTDAERAMAHDFSAYWVNFARTGNPNGPDLPQWTPFSAKNPRYMEIGDAPGMIGVPNLARLKLWEAYFRWRREGGK